MAQQIKAFVFEPSSLSLIPRVHMVEAHTPWYSSTQIKKYSFKTKIKTSPMWKQKIRYFFKIKTLLSLFILV